MTAPIELLLLDTNIVLHLIRGSAFARSLDRAYALRERAERPLASVVTVGEILAFSKKLGWGDKKRARMLELLGELVVVDINTDAVLQRDAEIDDYLRRNGRPMGQNDMWIAATAAATTATLLTTDKDFDPLEGTFITRIYLDQSPASTAPGTK
jgi:tRNA(fMet)-specific endonuclease VapC